MASSVATTPPQYPRWDGPVCRSNAWLFCPKRWRRQSGTMSHHVLLPATHRTHQHARSKTYHAASSASLFSTAAHAGGADGAHRSYSSTSPTAHDDAGAHGGHRRAASMLLMPPLASSSAATAETWPMNFCPPRPTDASLPAIPASLETTSPWMDDAAVGLHGTVAAALSPVAMPTGEHERAPTTVLSGSVPITPRRRRELSLRRQRSVTTAAVSPPRTCSTSHAFVHAAAPASCAPVASAAPCAASPPAPWRSMATGASSPALPHDGAWETQLAWGDVLSSPKASPEPVARGASSSPDSLAGRRAAWTGDAAASTPLAPGSPRAALVAATPATAARSQRQEMVPHSICRMLFSSEHHDDATAPADADVDARTWRLPLAEAIEMDGPAGPDADGASVASTSPALSSTPAPVPHLLQPTPLPAALTLDSAKRRTVSAPASPPPPAARALSSVDARAEGSTPSTDPSHAPLSVPTPARSHSPTTASSPTAAATTLPRRPSSAEASKKRSLASAEPTAPRWKRERMPACDIAVAGLVTLVHCPYRFATVYPLSYSSQSPSLASHGFANSSEDPTSPVAWANADSRTTTPRTAPSHDRTPIMVWQIADDTLEACGAGGAAGAAGAESSSAAVTATDASTVTAASAAKASAAPTAPTDAAVQAPTGPRFQSLWFDSERGVYSSATLRLAPDAPLTPTTPLTSASMHKLLPLAGHPARAASASGSGVPPSPHDASDRHSLQAAAMAAATSASPRHAAWHAARYARHAAYAQLQSPPQQSDDETQHQNDDALFGRLSRPPESSAVHSMARSMVFPTMLS